MSILARAEQFNDKTKADKLMLCVGAPTRVGKSFIGCTTWPKGTRILQFLTILDSHGWESGHRIAQRMPIYLDEDGNLIDDLTMRYDNFIDMIEDPDSVDEIVDNFDVLLLDGMNLDHIIHKHIDCIPSKDRGITKYDVWANITDKYARVFEALKAINERGVHVICNLTYEEADDRFVPTIQGKPGIKVPSWFKDVLFLKSDKNGHAVWSTNKVVRKESSSFGGEGEDKIIYENIIGGRLGRYNVRNLEGKQASMAGLLGYMKNGGKWPEVKKAVA